MRSVCRGSVPCEARMCCPSREASRWLVGQKASGGWRLMYGGPASGPRWHLTARRPLVRRRGRVRRDSFPCPGRAGRMRRQCGYRDCRP
jgi:hypothetical protein